ncbi:isochorismatase family protein [Prauserella rugosa]|uniref:Bifunctional isochorismate lyase/aryl carrier protein n=1 Tax=Prauserella rugosa TaxID=43354 RepID=A0A660CGB0_9PSEU|nr:isochorismatase family protein [Prauserella rugosa]KMS80877.1 2,3-dihydro-2,3-dihydroxybenzoate synthetase [Streptomyces regensis]TWH22386.1 bifunctional isochorismate lyase/aryl carrier protein [Prauserella rugosa]
MWLSLPKIEPYRLPTSDELPSGRVDWRLDASRAALLVHDMQRYFLRPFAGAPVPDVIANIAALVDKCHERGVPVYYTAQPAKPPQGERGLQTDFWGEGMRAHVDADPGVADVVDELAPSDADTVLVKWRYSAFQRSDFAERLAAQGRDQLMITGVYAHIGCQATAQEAFMRDVRPFLVADAVADFSRERHDQACAYVAGVCGSVVDTAAAKDALTAPVPAAAL